MKKFFDFIKTVLFFFWNTQMRYSDGRIVPDIRRRFKSWMLSRDITKGKIVPAAKQKGKPRVYEIKMNGKTANLKGGIDG